MEIVLTKEDIETLVKNYYNGVNSVKFKSKNPKVILNVDITKFIGNQKSKHLNTTTTINNDSEQKPKLTDEDKFKKEASQGLMASGGEKRVLMRF